MSKVAKKTQNTKLELAKAVNSLVAKEEAFNNAVKVLENFSAEVLKNLELEIESKHNERAELEIENENRKKFLQIETDQNIKEYQYSAAEKIIKEHGEVCVDEDEWNALNTQIATLKETHQKELNELSKTLVNKHKRELESELKTSELTHQAKEAEVNARVGQQKKEIELLERTIDNLKTEISEQRKLTASVAESSRPQLQNWGNGGNGGK